MVTWNLKSFKIWMLKAHICYVTCSKHASLSTTSFAALYVENFKARLMGVLWVSGISTFEISVFHECPTSHGGCVRDGHIIFFSSTSIQLPKGRSLNLSMIFPAAASSNSLSFLFQGTSRITRYVCERLTVHSTDKIFGEIWALQLSGLLWMHRLWLVQRLVFCLDFPVIVHSFYPCDCNPITADLISCWKALSMIFKKEQFSFSC